MKTNFKKAARKFIRAGGKPSINSNGQRYVWVDGVTAFGNQSKAGRVGTSHLCILPAS